MTVCSLGGLQTEQAGLGTEERKNCYPWFTNRAQQYRETKWLAQGHTGCPGQSPGNESRSQGEPFGLSHRQVLFVKDNEKNNLESATSQQDSCRLSI